MWRRLCSPPMGRPECTPTAAKRSGYALPRMAAMAPPADRPVTKTRSASRPKRVFIASTIAAALKKERQNPRRRRTVRRRKNSMGADAMYYALQQKRIPWSKMSRAQIEDVMQDAARHGDTKLYARAKAALARR